MPPRVGLVTFGGGLPNWRAAARRLGQQATESGMFSKVWVVDDRSLTVLYPDFADLHSHILRPSHRGFGYWIWKPFLLSCALRDQLSDCDYVLYLDSGFHINHVNIAARRRLTEYLSLADSDMGVAGMTLPNHPEISWTKREVLNTLRLSTHGQQSDQIQATPIAKVGASSINFCEQWLELCMQDNYRLVRDPANPHLESEAFIAHRHDQSIFSCLGKATGINTIPDETYWHPNWVEKGAKFPLWATRNRSRVDFLDKSPKAQLVRIFDKSYSRIFMEFNLRLSRPLNRT